MFGSFVLGLLAVASLIVQDARDSDSPNQSQRPVQIVVSETILDLSNQESVDHFVLASSDPGLRTIRLRDIRKALRGMYTEGHQPDGTLEAYSSAINRLRHAATRIHSEDESITADIATLWTILQLQSDLVMFDQIDDEQMQAVITQPLEDVDLFLFAIAERDSHLSPSQQAAAWSSALHDAASFLYVSKYYRSSADMYLELADYLSTLIQEDPANHALELLKTDHVLRHASESLIAFGDARQAVDILRRIDALPEGHKTGNPNFHALGALAAHRHHANEFPFAFAGAWLDSNNWDESTLEMLNRYSIALCLDPTLHREHFDQFLSYYENVLDNHKELLESAPGHVSAQLLYTSWMVHVELKNTKLAESLASQYLEDHADRPAATIVAHWLFRRH